MTREASGVRCFSPVGTKNTRLLGWLLAVAIVTLAAIGCGTEDGGDPAASVGSGPNSGGAGGAGVGGSASSSGGSGAGLPADYRCPTSFRFAPTFSLSNPRVVGEWQSFDLGSALVLSDDDSDGIHEGVVALEPGLRAYKIVYEINGNTEWVLDPDQTRRKYDGGIENSAVLVPDCGKPRLAVTASTVTRAAPGQGRYQASLAFIDAIDESGSAADGYVAELIKDDVTLSIAGGGVVVASDGGVAVDIAGLADGKYTLELSARTQSGLSGDPLRLVFWVEAEPFSWKDALIYMVMTDRFADGDASNDPPATPGADPRGDWQGGDLEGLRQAIAAGTLDELGVRAIWLTPFNTNPTGAYLAADDVHQVTGYHGYWPVKAREVDPRIGGAAALKALVKEAHAHGIRLLMDFVVNHVHEDHEYVSQHPDWFRTGCVCGTANCDWTSHALDCMFRTYMPDVDHTVPEANAQMVEDAVWWLDAFDLDGLRVDAVKHVEEIATRNLAAAVREGFEAAGTRYFLMGETAMGWNDCADPCNDENYGTIAKYVGPHGLDGQFDFVLYHGVSYRTFAYGDQGMLHADYWLQHGLSKWPADAIMTPYIGSHDTARFTSLADYRGQDGAHDRSIPGNQWSNTATAPTDPEPYRRMRVGMSWLLGLPGAPLLYYGDEYGEWGGADPNNRAMWRSESQLDSDELATLVHVRKLGTARRQIEALRRGDYQSLGATEDTLSFARTYAGTAAVVSLTRSYQAESVNVDLSATGIAANTVLHDAMGGPDVTVSSNGWASYSVPAGGAVVLAP